MLQTHSRYPAQSTACGRVCVCVAKDKVDQIWMWSHLQTEQTSFQGRWKRGPICSCQIPLSCSTKTCSIAFTGRNAHHDSVILLPLPLSDTWHFSIVNGVFSYQWDARCSFEKGLQSVACLKIPEQDGTRGLITGDEERSHLTPLDSAVKKN